MAFFEKLSVYIGSRVKDLIDRPSDPHVFRLHKNRVYYIREALVRKAAFCERRRLVGLGTCFGKFTKGGRFMLHVTSLEYLAHLAKVRGEAGGRG